VVQFLDASRVRPRRHPPQASRKKRDMTSFPRGKSEALRRGTRSSNPSPSSGESQTNFGADSFNRTRKWRLPRRRRASEGSPLQIVTVAPGSAAMLEMGGGLDALTIIGKMVSTRASSIYQLSIADLAEMGVDVSHDGPSSPSPRDLIGRHTALPPSVPNPVSPTPATSPMFQKGLTDHTAWQKWVDSFSGEFRAGIEWWASQRSMPNPGSCVGAPGFVAGCSQAKARLAPYDLLRKTQPEYKLGWNSYTDAPSYFVQVASRQIYSDAEAVKQSVASLGTVQITPVTVSGAQWYRVDIGPLMSADEATAIRMRARSSSLG